jgi:hypothetical protein
MRQGNTRPGAYDQPTRLRAEPRDRREGQDGARIRRVVQKGQFRREVGTDNVLEALPTRRSGLPKAVWRDSLQDPDPGTHASPARAFHEEGAKEGARSNLS